MDIAASAGLDWVISGPLGLNIFGRITPHTGDALFGTSLFITVRELERACPDASRDMIKKVLRDLKKSSKIRCLGKGPGTKWINKGNIEK